MSSSLEGFRSVLSDIEEIPYCTGAVALNAASSKLFYQSGDTKAEMIDFSQPSEEQLSALATPCDPATFGLGQKDVLDESYRKAGKLDSDRFAMHFSPSDLGIVDIICDNLLRGRKSKMDVQVELYKLNVYGPGAFFKSHVDTPRSDKMFGSLVVILPTPHEGGSLLFRHHGQEWTFDSAKAVSSETTPRAAFVTFFSDVEHEVATVTSGYRVTLTYNLNLYFIKDAAAPAVVLSNNQTSDDQLLAALEGILKDKSHLPDGGLIGFGLSHKYPITSSTNLEDLANCLKGTDDTLYRLCESLSLDCALKFCFRDSYESDVVCLLDYSAGVKGVTVENHVVRHLRDTMHGRLVYDPDGDGEPLDYYEEEELEEILWVKPAGDTNRFEEHYVYCGNEASLSCAYGDVCLVADVLPADERG